MINQKTNSDVALDALWDVASNPQNNVSDRIVSAKMLLQADQTFRDAARTETEKMFQQKPAFMQASFSDWTLLFLRISVALMPAVVVVSSFYVLATVLLQVAAVMSQ